MSQEQTINWKSFSLVALLFIIIGCVWLFRFSGSLNITMESETDYSFIKSSLKAAKIAGLALICFAGVWIYKKVKVD